MTSSAVSITQAPVPAIGNNPNEESLYGQTKDVPAWVPAFLARKFQNVSVRARGNDNVTTLIFNISGAQQGGELARLFPNAALVNSTRDKNAKTNEGLLYIMFPNRSFREPA